MCTPIFLHGVKINAFKVTFFLAAVGIPDTYPTHMLNKEGKFVFVHAIKADGGERFSSAQSSPRHYVEETNLLHDPAGSPPAKLSPIPIEQENRICVPQSQ